VKTKTISVPTQDEDEEEIDLSGKRYGVLTGKPCGQMYKLEPAEYDYDRWFFSVSENTTFTEKFIFKQHLSHT
jgi:hypothetical protein